MTARVAKQRTAVEVAAELADAERLARQCVAVGRRAGTLLWWVVLLDRAYTPSGIMVVSIHEDPVARLDELQRVMLTHPKLPATWRVALCPVELAALDEDDLAVVVTLPRDRPLMTSDDRGDFPAQPVSAVEVEVLRRIVPADLGRKRPWRVEPGGKRE